MVPFVGPSYRLANRKASAQRSVNLYLEQTEPGGSKPAYYMRPAETLRVTGSVIDAAPGRGVFGTVDGQFFAVLGEDVFSLSATLARTDIGTLLTSSGKVSGAVGRTQIVLSDNVDGYVLDPSALTVTRITDADFIGEGKVVYYGGRFVFKGPDDQFIWSAIDDGATYDALDFATAESAPDGLVTLEVYRDELWLFGTQTTEVWRVSFSADQTFERNTSVAISIGCAARDSVATVDNSMLWVGQDGNGGPVVYMARGYDPQRVSTHAIEELLLSSTNIRRATAFAYQYRGHAFYCLNAPGLSTTWVYDLSVGEWHERGVMDGFGDWQPLPYNSHAFTGSRHVFCGADDSEGYVEELSDTATPNAPTERTSPHFSSPSQNEVFYSRFRLDCSTGGAGTSRCELAWSDDGGRTWSNSRLADLGGAGAFSQRIQWNRLGRSRDRIWRLRGPSDASMDIIEVSIDAEEGVA